MPLGGNKFFLKKRDAPRVATNIFGEEDPPGWQKNLFEEERCPWVATKYLWRREIPLSGNKNHRLIDRNMLSGWRWYQIVKSEQKGLFHNWLELNYQDLKRSVKGGSWLNRLEKLWKTKKFNLRNKTQPLCWLGDQKQHESPSAMLQCIFWWSASC